MELLSKQQKLHNQLGNDHGIWEKFSPSRQIQFQGTCLGLNKYLTANFNDFIMVCTELSFDQFDDILCLCSPLERWKYSFEGK